jgi:hypothetical protein
MAQFPPPVYYSGDTLSLILLSKRVRLIASGPLAFEASTAAGNPSRRLRAAHVMAGTGTSVTE